ncbi:unnamed protein product [Leuciscus chuanchicus]
MGPVKVTGRHKAGEGHRKTLGAVRDTAQKRPQCCAVTLAVLQCLLVTLTSPGVLWLPLPAPWDCAVTLTILQCLLVTLISPSVLRLPSSPPMSFRDPHRPQCCVMTRNDPSVFCDPHRAQYLAVGVTSPIVFW